MRFRRLSLTSCIAVTVALSATSLSAFAAPSTTDSSSSPVLATPAINSAPPVVSNLTASYAGLQGVWDDCYRLKSVSADLLAEGKNAPARKQWLDYYVDTVTKQLVNLQSQCAQTSFPGELQASVSQPWSDVKAAIDLIQTNSQQLQADASNVKSPTDDKYPPLFWGAARGIADGADKLDKSLLVVYNILDSSPQNAVFSATEQAAGGASNTTAEIVLKGKASIDPSHRVFSELTDTSRRIGKSCFEFFGELERFNLLYAKAPKGEPANMFYGGAFTRQEVLSQYKYMPDLAFTTASYVKLNSYPIPPRKNMLGYYTDQIGTLLNLAESQVNSIQIPAGKEDAVLAPLKAIKDKFADARTQYLALFKLVQAASDQNLADIHADQATYGPPVMNIDHDINDLQVAVNDLMTIVTAK